MNNSLIDTHTARVKIVHSIYQMELWRKELIKDGFRILVEVIHDSTYIEIKYIDVDSDSLPH